MKDGFQRNFRPKADYPLALGNNPTESNAPSISLRLRYIKKGQHGSWFLTP